MSNCLCSSVQCANMLSLKESFTQDCSNPFLFPKVHGKI
jgi:hypothetical protein